MVTVKIMRKSAASITSRATGPLRRLVALIAACLAAVTLAGAAAGPAAADDSVVRTDSGWVRGTVAPDHRSFQGIPYAAPPVGALRWRAPRPASSWHGVRDATRPGAWCPQAWDTEPGKPRQIVGSEDCLFVNVDTPGQATGPLPVMVFLHGGGFTGGSGAPYETTRIRTQGRVVVVTLNYRLGALGFLDHPALRDPYAGNFGLADQQAALRWVRRNIAAFGGEPGNVTLWGESAGGYSTCAQLAAPGARGLFHKAIVHSAPCGNSFVTRQVAEQRGLTTASKLGCPDPGSAAQCLRGTPLKDLAGLYEDQVGTVHRRIAELPWFPVAGTPALPLQPLTALRLGSAAGVPLIQGGTRDEMRQFVADTYDRKGHPVGAAEYPEILRAWFGPKEARDILGAYPLTRYPSPSLALATLLTDYGRMFGPCSQLPADDAAARRASVFAYEFGEPDPAKVGDFPLGAHHGVDIPYFFDSSQHWPGSPPPPTGAQKALADRLIGYWTTFARTGKPGPDWPAYRHGTAVSLTVHRIGPVDLAREHRCGFWRSRP
jgi:para-nitrobenzyl esterase